MVIDFLSWLFLAILWGYTFWQLSKLPEIIPTHFGLGGKADSFGSKNSILGLPIIATFAVGLLQFFSGKPQYFNYPVKITEANKAKQQKLSLQMLSFLRLLIPIMFLFLVFCIVTAVENPESKLTSWIFVFVALIFVVAGWNVYLSFKNK